MDNTIYNWQESNSEVILQDKMVFTESLNEDSATYVLEILTDNEIVKKYKIHGEEFNIYADGENLIITHPRWSISGFGKTLIDAERNLFKEAKEVLEHYNKYSISELSNDAKLMKDFLKQII